MTDFQGQQLPEPGRLAGYAALVNAFGLPVPAPSVLSLISLKHRRYDTPEWRVLTPRHAPAADAIGHLDFALRHEALDLGVLRALFDVLPAATVAGWVRDQPTGRTRRRLWFYYEWLMGNALDVPDVREGGYVPALDGRQFGLARGDRLR
ncbi:MAG: cell filamentation protein Fic, partial [Planctomycetaceae bacterium]|nr:cell filamentation protein Fic [Planctomycetaceae bacterium]